YRQAHSLKGSSSSLGVVELEQLAHNLEEALLPVRRGQTAFLTPAMVDLSLRAMDAVKLRVDGLVNDNEIGLRETNEAAAALGQLALPRASEAAAAEPLGGAPPVEAVAAPAPVAEDAIDDETMRIHTGR